MKADAAEIEAMTHIQNTAPGPPVAMAVATPAMLPVPTREAVETAQAHLDTVIETLNETFEESLREIDYTTAFISNKVRSTQNDCVVQFLTAQELNAQIASLQQARNYLFNRYNFKAYLGGLENSGANNGCGLVPSRDPEGNLYPYKLGGPYEKFNDKDIRKQLYVYTGGGKYRGMFFVGRLVNPVDTTWRCGGAREYKGQVINIVDQISYLTRVRNDNYKNEDGSYQYNSVSDLPSTIQTAEENSCVRVMKLSPRPTENEVDVMYNPDVPVIRLAEIYYMLAECKMRTGDKAGAAELINTVRKRYFADGVDPDPVTVANLDKYRMLNEWQEEFLCEERRRTDLIRWNAYVTEDWWDHKATNNEDLNRFPVHYSILNANQLLTQNPGYGRD